MAIFHSLSLLERTSCSSHMLHGISRLIPKYPGSPGGFPGETPVRTGALKGPGPRTVPWAMGNLLPPPCCCSENGARLVERGLSSRCSAEKLAGEMLLKQTREG